MVVLAAAYALLTIVLWTSIQVLWSVMRATRIPSWVT